MTKRYKVRSYKSHTLRKTVYQVVDTLTENWVYESLDRHAAVLDAKERNDEPQQVPA